MLSESGGVRLEDVAFITPKASRNLTKFEKVLKCDDSRGKFGDVTVSVRLVCIRQSQDLLISSKPEVVSI